MKHVYCIYKVLDIDTMQLERVLIEDPDADYDGRLHPYGYLDEYRAESYITKLIESGDDAYTAYIIQTLHMYFNA